MPNQNSQNKHRVPFYRRPVVIAGLLAVLVAAIILTIWAFSSFSHPSEPSKNPNPSETTSPDQPSVQQPGLDETPEKPDRPAQFEGEDPNDLPELTGSIALNTHDADTLTVAVAIDQYLVSSGLCRLELSKDGHTLRSAELAATADVTTSGCGPFHIPISDLSPGIYQLKITISGDDKTGLITGEVQI